MMISAANSNDHLSLTDLTIQSKAHWGYSAEQIKAWTEDLTIYPEYIEKNEVFNLVINDEIIGYYSYFKTSENEVQLDNLFLSPKFIGKGFGRLLLNDFIERIKQHGANEIILYSDPHAEKFYDYFGFIVIGKQETSIEGRFLPIMRKVLT